MIVVGTNVLAYLYLPTEFTPLAEPAAQCAYPLPAQATADIRSGLRDTDGGGDAPGGSRIHSRFL